MGKHVRWFLVSMVCGLAVGEMLWGAERLVPSEYGTINEAINAAVEGDVVIVDDGTYTHSGNGDIDFQGKAITVRSANGPANCIISFFLTGVPRGGDWGNGFYFHNGEGPGSVVDGFTVISNDYYPSRGVTCRQAAPTIRNCRFIQNSVGIYCENAGPTVTDCTATDNLIGVYCQGGAATIDRCTARGNGGMIRTRTPTDTSNLPIVTGVTMTAGGINCSGASPTIANTVIGGNIGGDQSGGLSLLNGSSVSATNCTIVGNKGDDEGGVYCAASNLTMRNCIVWDNVAGSGGDTITAVSGSLSGSVDTGVSTMDIDYCCIQGGIGGVRVGGDSTLTWGTSNVVTHPGFYTPGYWRINEWVQGDYQLLDVSPGVDVGLNDAVAGFVADVAQNGRVFNGTVDMGAYERQALGVDPNRIEALTVRQFTAIANADGATGMFILNANVVNPPTSYLSGPISIKVGPYAERLENPRQVGATLMHQGRSGAISMLQLNLNTGNLMVIGSGVYLIGLSSPTPISISFDEYGAEGTYEGNTPTPFLNGYADLLAVDSALTTPTMALFRGRLAIGDGSLCLLCEDMTIRWGPGENAVAVLPAGAFRQLGASAFYSSLYGKVRLMQISSRQGTFMMMINDSSVPTGGDLYLSFGTFEETAAF